MIPCTNITGDAFPGGHYVYRTVSPDHCEFSIPLSLYSVRFVGILAKDHLLADSYKPGSACDSRDLMNCNVLYATTLE